MSAALPSSVRTVDTLGDAELLTLQASSSISRVDRDLVEKELAVRARAAARRAAPLSVAIVANDIPFWDVVRLQVKWSFASIPAIAIIATVWLAVTGIVGVISAALFRGR